MALISATKTCEEMGIKKPTLEQRNERKKQNEENNNELLRTFLMNDFSFHKVKGIYLETVREDIGKMELDKNCKEKGQYASKDLFLVKGKRTVENEKLLYDICLAKGKEFNQESFLFFGKDEIGVNVNTNCTDETKPYVAYITNENGEEQIINYGDDEKQTYGIDRKNLSLEEVYNKMKEYKGKKDGFIGLKIYRKIKNGADTVYAYLGEKGFFEYKRYLKSIRKNWNSKDKIYNWENIKITPVDIIKENKIRKIHQFLEKPNFCAFLSANLFLTHFYKGSLDDELSNERSRSKEKMENELYKLEKKYMVSLQRNIVMKKYLTL